MGKFLIFFRRFLVFYMISILAALFTIFVLWSHVDLFNYLMIAIFGSSVLAYSKFKLV